MELRIESINEDVHLHSDISALGKAIIKTILYFDIFNYPLKQNELYNYCQYKSASVNEIKKETESLVKEGYVRMKDDFYFVSDDLSIIERRITGNRISEKYLKAAYKYSRIISRFPFVEGIGITGSLSKNYMEESGDIDYFIITAPNRLWICRTLLILFKKIFLLNSHKYFCVNYFIDTNNLEIPDKNIFTATELVFVIPTYNRDLYNKFMDSNSWANDYYPNFRRIKSLKDIPERTYWVRNIVEKILKGRVGEWLDSLFFKTTLKHWKKKFKDFNEEDFDLNMRSRKSASKHHPSGFQTKVLKGLEEKINSYEQRFNVKL